MGARRGRPGGGDADIRREQALFSSARGITSTVPRSRWPPRTTNVVVAVEKEERGREREYIDERVSEKARGGFGRGLCGGGIVLEGNPM